MHLPTANKAVVESLIEAAIHKVERNRERVSRIDSHIAALEQERMAAETTLEYFELGSKRRTLVLDLFVFPGEYGETEPLPDWHAEQLRQHANRMSLSVKHYQRCKERRLKAINFLQQDIKRLEVIRDAVYRPPIFFLAAVHA